MQIEARVYGGLPGVYGDMVYGDMGLRGLRGHDTNCTINGAVKGLGTLIFGNVYHVPVTPPVNPAP